jgi:hypothetical protein
VPEPPEVRQDDPGSSTDTFGEGAMANYTYQEESPRDGKHPWIDKLELIDPVEAASSDYAEIHFTKPK